VNIVMASFLASGGIGDGESVLVGISTMMVNRYDAIVPAVAQMPDLSISLASRNMQQPKVYKELVE
jgi:hypothetical protein